MKVSKNSLELSDELIDHFQSIGEGHAKLEHLVADFRVSRQSTKGNIFSNISILEKLLKICEVQYDLCLIPYSSYIHFTYGSITSFFEQQWLDGALDIELEPITAQMQVIKSSHGLSEDEGWNKDDEPDEYTKLKIEFEEILDDNHYKTLLQFKMTEIADLFLHDREKLDDLNEQGRKSVFIKGDVNRLIELVNLYENESRQASTVGAYYSAIVMLGAAIEAKLIIKCIKNPKICRYSCDKLGFTKKKLKSRNPLEWRLDKLIAICHESGWLPEFETMEFIIYPLGLAHRLREARNLLHPSLHIKRKMHFGISESQFKDWKYIYEAITTSIGNFD